MTDSVDLRLTASLDEFVAGLRTATEAFSGSLDTMRRTAQDKGSDIDQAFKTIGVESLQSVDEEIAKVRAAYDTLAKSGTVSAADLNRANQAVEERVRSLRGEAANLGEAFNRIRLSTVAAVGALAGVTRTLGAAAAASSEYQTALAEIGTLLADQSGIPEITAQLNEQARTFGGSVVAQAKAYYQIISAGAKQGAEANAILTASNQLAIGGLTSIQQAADGLTSVLNAYGLGASDATRVSDLFFSTVKDGKTTIDELSGTLGRVAPLASEAGVGLDELLAAVAALTKTGASTEQAVTAIRGALTGIIKPTSEAADLAERLGLSFDSAALKSRGFAGFLADVAAATGGNQEQLAQLFGSVEGLNGVLALTGSQAESFAASLRNMGDSAGAAQRAFELIDDTPAQRLARFQAATEQVQLAFGRAVTSLSPLLEGLGGLLNGFTSLPGPVQTTAVGLLGLAGAATAVLVAFRTVAPVLAGFASALGVSGLLGSVGAAAGAVATLQGALAALGRVAVPLALAAPVVELTRALFEARAAAESLEKTQADRLAQVEQELEARRRIASELRVLSDQEVLSAERLAQLGKAELIEYNRKLDLARQYNQAQIGIALRQDEISGATEETGEQLRQSKLRADELRGALTAVAAALKASTEDLRPRFQSVQEAFTELGVSAETAGQKITETGRVALRAFDSIASTAETNARQILESYSLALQRLNTSAEVRQLGSSLSQALQDGRISLEQFIEKSIEAAARLREIGSGAQVAEDALAGAGKGADAVAEGADAATESLGAAAQQGQQVGEALDQAGTAAGAAGEQIAGAFNRVGAAQALTDAIALVRTEFSALGPEITATFDQLLLDFARGERTITGMFRAVTAAQEQTRALYNAQAEAAGRQAEAFANLSEEAIRRLAATGTSAEALEARAGRLGQIFDQLGDQDLGPLRSALAAAAGQVRSLQNEADSAVAALDRMNGELEKARLRDEGRQEELAELELQERLREIDELAQAAGVAGQETARRNRELAEAEHRRRLQEIADEAAAERGADRGPRSGGSGSGDSGGGGGSGRGGGTHRIELVISNAQGASSGTGAARFTEADIRYLAEAITGLLRDDFANSL